MLKVMLPILFAEIARADPDIAEAFAKGPQSAYIYNRQSENEYWDGFKSDMPFMVMDDFLQRPDSVQQPNPEIFEVIRIVNAAPFTPHAAAVEEKGKQFVNTRALIATSNVKEVEAHIKSISDPSAFVRRIDMFAEVTVHPDFAKVHNGVRMIDSSKCVMKEEK